MRIQQVTAIATAVRVIQAVATRTFFSADEYFQSLEIAHRAVFGYGPRTWEWETVKPIRSILFPSLWIPVYWILKITGLDGTNALIWLPKIQQGLFASVVDVAVCRLSGKLLGPQAIPITLVVSLCSFFHSLALVRSLSNSLETSLMILALSYWPLHPKSPVSFRMLLRPLVIASFACAIRPTNAVIWIYLCAQLVIQKPGSIYNLMKSTALVGITALSLITLTDSLYFGTLTFTPLNFFRVNMSSIALFYGENPWHYYLTQAIPVLLTTTLPLFIDGVYRTLWSNHRELPNAPALQNLLGLLTWTVAIYSLAGHKEWRFIHPILPVMHIFCAIPLQLHGKRNSKTDKKSSPFSILLKPWGFLVLLCLPASIYVTFVHGRAQIAVVDYLRSISENDLQSIGFLMPCHSTPWMAYLHRPSLTEGRAWALGCEPPMGVTNASTYLDQTSAFYLSPETYLSSYFPARVDPAFPPSPYPRSLPGSPIPSLSSSNNLYTRSGILLMDEWKHTWPQYLVMFGVLPKSKFNEDSDVATILQKLGYSRVWRTWNGFEEDEKRKGGVEVWKWTST